jgi:hypothetical protein
VTAHEKNPEFSSEDHKMIADLAGVHSDETGENDKKTLLGKRLEKQRGATTSTTAGVAFTEPTNGLVALPTFAPLRDGPHKSTHQSSCSSGTVGSSGSSGSSRRLSLRNSLTQGLKQSLSLGKLFDTTTNTTSAAAAAFSTANADRPHGYQGGSHRSQRQKSLGSIGRFGVVGSSYARDHDVDDDDDEQSSVQGDDLEPVIANTSSKYMLNPRKRSEFESS